MHLSDTAKPITERTAPIQRQRATPIASTRKSNHDGSNQNDSAKKDAPTASEAVVQVIEPPAPGDEQLQPGAGVSDE